MFSPKLFIVFFYFNFVYAFINNPNFYQKKIYKYVYKNYNTRLKALLDRDDNEDNKKRKKKNKLSINKKKYEDIDEIYYDEDLIMIQQQLNYLYNMSIETNKRKD